MSQEDKELLLQYLCMSLPYEVKVVCSNFIMEVRGIDSVSQTADIIEYGKHRFSAVPIEEIKPYLRSMEDITDEEKSELFELCTFAEYENWEGKITETYCVEVASRFDSIHNYDTSFHFYDTNIRVVIVWFLKNHFNLFLPDHLYIKVTNENNPYK